MSTRRYRLLGVDPDDLNDLVEAASGSSLNLLAKALWAEVTVADGTRDIDLDDYMATLGYTPDTTGPTIVITSGPHSVGTESTVLVDATAGPITVDIPLLSARYGNDVTVMKIDSSSNAVTVSRSGADTIQGVTTQTLLQGGEALLLVANETNTDWNIAASTRALDSYYDNTGTTITATNVQDALSDILVGDATSCLLFTAGENLTAGDLVVLNTSGEVVRADSSIAGGNWRVMGVAKATVLSGAQVAVSTKAGAMPNVRFGTPPGAASNGSLVFLSTTSGVATTTPPVTSGNTIYRIGFLQGADGATTTPAVLFFPQFTAQRP